MRTAVLFILLSCFALAASASEERPVRSGTITEPLATPDDYDRWKRFLRREFPTKFPVRFQIVSAETLAEMHKEMVFGDCTIKDGRCAIRIRAGLSQQQGFETTFHEYVHALREHLPDMPGDSGHDELYWCIYARVYKAWFSEHPRQ